MMCYLIISIVLKTCLPQLWNTSGGEIIYFGDTVVEVKVSSPYKFEMTNYEEGAVAIFSFPNLACLIITSNPLVSFEYDDYSPSKTIVIKEAILYEGSHADYHWSKVVYRHTRIYFVQDPSIRENELLSSIRLINKGETVFEYLFNQWLSTE